MAISGLSRNGQEKYNLIHTAFAWKIRITTIRVDNIASEILIFQHLMADQQKCKQTQHRQKNVIDTKLQHIFYIERHSNSPNAGSSILYSRYVAARINQSIGLQMNFCIESLSMLCNASKYHYSRLIAAYKFLVHAFFCFCSEI